MEKNDVMRFEEKYNAVLRMLEDYTESIGDDEWMDLFDALGVLTDVIYITSVLSAPSETVDSAVKITMFMLGRAYERGDEVLMDFLNDKGVQETGKEIFQGIKDRAEKRLES